VLIERAAYKPLRNAPRVSAVITALGVGLFLEHFVLATVGAEPRLFPLLVNLDVYVLPGGLVANSIHVLIFAVALVLMLALDWFVRRTLTGMAMRAISYDRTIVPLMGISVDRIISLTFAVGSGLAAAGGILFGQAYPIIDPYMGSGRLEAFVAAVVGGIGNIRGAMLGAYILGMTEIYVAAFLPSTYRDFVAFSLLLLLLVFRPTGILGRITAQKV